MIGTTPAIKPDNPLGDHPSKDQCFVGRVLTRHVGLKPDLRKILMPFLVQI
jgi:hypothetical protein